MQISYFYNTSKIYYNRMLFKTIHKRHIYENPIHSMQLILFRQKTWLYVHLMDKQRTRELFIHKQWTHRYEIDSDTIKFWHTNNKKNNRINTTKFNNVINKINTIITKTTIMIISNNKTMTYRDNQLRRKHKCTSTFTVNTRNSPFKHACKLPNFIDHEKLILSVKHEKHNYIPCIVRLYKIMLKNCPFKTHKSS